MGTTIQSIIVWVESLNCDCKNSERLQRLLNSLLSENTEMEIFTSTTHTDEISNLISAVELYKFMSTPVNFLSRFGIVDVKACPCNEYKSNYKLSSCFIRQTRKSLLCSNCILPHIQSSDYSDDDNNDLVTIIDYVSNRINNEKTRELFDLYKCLLNSNRPPLNGSWATLIIKDRMRTAQKYTTLIKNVEKTTLTENESSLSLLSGYVLVSNRIRPSRRGRDACYCSDLLYVFTYIKSIDRQSFGVKPTKICLLDEEYMLIEYELCSLNSVLSHIEKDKLKHIHKDKKQGTKKIGDGNSGSVNGGGVVVNDSDDNESAADNANTDYMNMGSILLSIYKNATMGNNCGSGSNFNDDDSIQSYNTNNEIAANAAALLGDYRNATIADAAVKTTTVTPIDDTNNAITNKNKSDTICGIILPPPITQQTTLEQLRKTTKAVSYISTKDMDQNLLSLRVLKFDDIIYPYSCSLLPPPILIRKSFNTYMFLSNINEYFDSIKFCTKIVSIPVKNSTLYEQIMMTINTIRELSLIVCCDKYDNDDCKGEENTAGDNHKSNDDNNNKREEPPIGNNNIDGDNDDDDNDDDDDIDINNDDDEDEDYDEDYDNDDNEDGHDSVNNKRKINKVSPIFNTRNINTQLGVPVTHDEEIQRYINITSLNHLLQKQENNLFLQN